MAEKQEEEEKMRTKIKTNPKQERGKKMKTRIFTFIIISTLIIPVSSFAKTVFSVKPGFGIQGSHIGIQKGRLTPYIGLDLIRIGGKVKNGDEDWAFDSGTNTLYRSHTGSLDISGSATLIIPHFGLKYHFAEEDKKLRPYLLGDFFKSIPFVSVDGTENDTYYNPDGTVSNTSENDILLEQNEEDAIKSLLGVWGFALAFGSDYSLSEHFSIGGEYGIRLFFASSSQSTTDSGDFNNDGITDWRENWDSELSGSLQLSYAAIALNYHF